MFGRSLKVQKESKDGDNKSYKGNVMLYAISRRANVTLIYTPTLRHRERNKEKEENVNNTVVVVPAM